MAALFGSGWLVMAGFGYYNTKVLNTYQSDDEQEKLQVRYEKDYKKYEHMPQPHYTDVSYFIDLDPAARSIVYSAGIVLKNKDKVAIDTLYFNVPNRMQVKLDIPGAELVLNDSALDQRMYRLSTPLQPGGRSSSPAREAGNRTDLQQRGVHRAGGQRKLLQQHGPHTRHRLRPERGDPRP
ncbi:MAG: hypothetical protein IPI95_14790 [Flavobacteriales bacterium]|nr:hypothetical protein [Flavobacteriales bacterium]